MKKIPASVLALTMLLALAACGSGNGNSGTVAGGSNPSPAVSAPAAGSDTAPTAETPAAEPSREPAAPEDEEVPEETEPVSDAMTHADYVAAEIGAPVVIETYVQAHQNWWDSKVTVYAQSEDGAYLLYNMGASWEEAEALTPGAKIRVTGDKSEWSGEVRIIDATFEPLQGSYVAPATDVTALLGSDELINHQNEFVSFKGMTVEAANEDGAAFLYDRDGSGRDGSDLCFRASLDGSSYAFLVESDLSGPGTDVYEAVKALNIGDVIDLEGFLCWYEGANPHITAVSPAA